MDVGYEIKVLTDTHFQAEIVLDYFNERLRVIDYRGNINNLVKAINEYVKTHTFSKVIVHSRPEHWELLVRKGFELEAVFSGYFNGTSCYAMTFYHNHNRRVSQYWAKESDLLLSIFEKEKKTSTVNPPTSYHFRRADMNDIKELATLYKDVFQVYPTPMNKPEYIGKMINEGNIFYIVEHNKQIVSAASADINTTFNHAELTDCATLPEHRKFGLIKKLLHLLEEELKQTGIFCAFSIARALSYGMNAALYQLGYEYGGRLTNNCYIFDKLEDMNVWVKDLSAENHS